MSVHPEPQTALCAALGGGGVPPGVTAVGDVARRFSVYRNNVHHSLGVALAERFPVVRRLVGEGFFAAAAGDFVRAHPPSSPILAEYGATFPDFLAGLGPVARLSYLPDVARLEWLRGRAYHAADAEALTPEAFSQAVATAEGDVGIALHPSVSLFAAPSPAVSIWQAHQGETRDPVPPGPEAALVFCHGDAVPVLPVRQDLFVILDGIRNGISLTSIARDAPSEAAAGALSVLLRHGLVTGLVPCLPPEETQ